MDYEKQIKDISSKLEQAKEKKNRATWRLEELKKEQIVLEEKIREQGLEPDQLENYINELEKEIESMLTEAFKLLPNEFKE